MNKFHLHLWVGGLAYPVVYQPAKRDDVVGTWSVDSSYSVGPAIDSLYLGIAIQEVSAKQSPNPHHFRVTPVLE